MKRFVVALFVICAFVWVAYPEGSITETRVSRNPPDKITLVWTASTNGIVSEDTQLVRGCLQRVVFYNGTSSAPTGVSYAVTIKDASGVDVLAGQCSAVPSSSASAYAYVPGVFVANSSGVTSIVEGVTVNEKLSISVTGVGSQKAGTIVIYSR